MQARELHRRAVESEQRAGELREQRNRLIRELAADRVPHQLIAQTLGCSKHLIASVVMDRVGPGRRGRRPT